MKRASYRVGVQWIADNDEALDRDAESIAGYISTILLAPAERVARDVLRKREAK